MTTKLSFEDFQTKALDIQSRLDVIDALFKEADALVQQVDINSFNDEERDEAYDLAYTIGRTGGWEFEGFGDRSGFWMPSTC